MNSYPPELLVQLVPTMFVAGVKANATNGSSDEKEIQDPFAGLIHRLRDVLLNLRKEAIWKPERDKRFQVVLVDKTAQFPPRKVPVEDDPSQALRSPLSPLVPTSPLYPDGLIAPIWVRKHISLIPAVFVLFLRLYESPASSPQSPLDLREFDKEKSVRDKEERVKDTELSAEIAERKKSTNERNIKLTVVLLASRKMLDDPALDSRLTFIRRQGGLDSRAALFVLSPVSNTELNDFVQSLQQALYEPAIEYYTSHSKRVRRKRNKHNHSHAHAPSMSAAPSNASLISQAHSKSSADASLRAFLRPEGWTVRYDYKMASFAEFRGEDEVALKHYHDSYTALLNMLSSTAVLPPRTKRWAEAKVLADCINLKICKLYLYNSEHSLALAKHNLHKNRFADLSRGWGIGEETYEFWSWMAKQHRLFAELLELGLRSSLKIPTHLPAEPSIASLASTSNSQIPQPEGNTRALGINPSSALQHPGFYYFMAAECTEKRRDRFLSILQDEEYKSTAYQLPGFVNEMKVDHSSVVLELYTKSYDIFRKFAPPHQTQNRQALRIAYRIAQTYYKSGKVDLAIKFFERISKTYRYERWRLVLKSLLSTWYACARQQGDVDLSIKLLVEMISYGHERTVDMEEGERIEDDLLAILKSTVPSSPDTKLIVDLPDGEPILTSTVMFWNAEVCISEPAPFQIHLTTKKKTTSLSSLPFTYLRVFIPDDGDNGDDTNAGLWVTVKHSADLEKSDEMLTLAGSSIPSSFSVSHVHLGTIELHPLTDERRDYEVTGNLSWPQGHIVVLSGIISSRKPGHALKITKAILGLEENGWHVEVPFKLGYDTRVSGLNPFWLESIDPPNLVPFWRRGYSSTTVHTRPHQLRVAFTHDQPAYVGEHYPITLEVTNDDDDYRELEVTVDLLLQPGEDDSANRIVFEDQESLGLIKGISFGNIKPGESSTKTLYLIPVGGAGNRLIDVSIVSRLVIPSTDGLFAESATASKFSSVRIPLNKDDVNENLETLTVSVTNPFKVSYETSYYRKWGKLRGLADLDTFEKDYWDDSVGGKASVQTTFEFAGRRDVDVKSIQLVRKTTRAKVVYTGLDDQETSMRWTDGDMFDDLCEISMSVGNDPDEDFDAIPGPGYYEISWARSSLEGKENKSTLISQTIFPLPSLRPPIEGLIALVRLPPIAHLHKSTTVELVIRNYHPTRSAHPFVYLDVGASESFIVSGLRTGRLPILLPGTEESFVWNLIPIECGNKLPIPKIRVVDRRNVEASEKGQEPESEGTEVEVVDFSWGTTGMVASSGNAHVSQAAESSAENPAGDIQSKEGRTITISVRPG